MKNKKTKLEFIIIIRASRAPLSFSIYDHIYYMFQTHHHHIYISNSKKTSKREEERESFVSCSCYCKKTYITNYIYIY